MTRTLRLGFRVSDNAGLGPVTLKPNTHHPQRGSHVCAECHSVCLGTQRGHVLGTQRGHVLVVMCSWSCAGPRRCVVMCWTAAWSCAGPRQRLGTREDLCLLTRAKGCARGTLWLYFSVSTVYAWTSPVPQCQSGAVRLRLDSRFGAGSPADPARLAKEPAHLCLPFLRGGARA